jgi:membrane-associated phospholipid phosphatase
VTFPLPIFVLLVLAVGVGVVVTFAALRLAPARGATAAATDAVEDAAEAVALRHPWVRARLDPEVATGLALTAAMVAAVIGGLILALLAVLIRGSVLRHIDGGAADWGNDHGSHLSTRLLYLVTDLGDWPVVPVVAIVVVVFELRRAWSRYLLPFLVVVIAGDELLTTVIKDAVNRARPTLNPLAAGLGPSFPSGHSSTAASFYAALALILARRRSPRVRALLVGAAAAIAVAVATSRVLLDVHWVSDVVAGVSLGWAWFAICAIAFGGRLLHFGAPAEKLATYQRGIVRAPGPSHTARRSEQRRRG